MSNPYRRIYADEWFAVDYVVDQPVYLRFTAHRIEGMDEHDPETKEWGHGFIKWDGCSEFTWTEADMHFCGWNLARQFSALIERLYEEAARVFPEHDLS